MHNKIRSFVAALCVFSLLSAPAAFSAEGVRVLVLDSGSDFTHNQLKDLALPNQAELNGVANKDDDKNGYKDDVYGWNFVENNSTIVDLSSTPPDYDKVLKCMELIGKIQAYGKEALTKEEFSFLVTNYNDPKFGPWIGFVGGWAHGTHCAGIISTDNDCVSLKAVRHIPTGAAPKAFVAQALSQINYELAHKNTRSSRAPEATKVTMGQLEDLFARLGQDYAAKAKKEAAYVASLKAKLINCSFGTENKQLLESFKQNMIQQWGWINPTDEEVQEVTNLFVEKALLARDKAFFSGCKDALIFIAAGNSSEDLDGITSSPNNVDIENKIVIGATDNNKKLADFSCHGTTIVDIAVPGVNIFATYPNQKMGYMSGTSMACPMALKFGSMVLNENPDLTPVELKKILMGTVDKKEWLKDKVRTGGVINVNRAMYAAMQIKAGKSIDEAISEANEKVNDIVVKSPNNFKGPDLEDKQIRDIYFSAVF